MREGHGALIWRAAAALGASLALHAAVMLVGGPLSLGSWSDDPMDGAPLIVDVIAGEAAPVRRAPPARMTAARPTHTASRPQAPRGPGASSQVSASVAATPSTVGDA